MGPAERPPHLSVVLVVGSQRRRAQRVLDALAAQTAADCIEVVVVDLIDGGPAPLHVAPSLRHVYASRPDINRWGRARAEAVRLASAEVIGFIEDHCFPEPEWAAVLIEAYRGPWAAVGYAFTNANPRTYVSRASMLARYGQFVDPARPGPARLVSGNNVSYRRDLLLSFGSELDGLLTIDFNLQEVLGKRGLPLLVEARARAAHTNFSNYARDTITGYWTAASSQRDGRRRRSGARCAGSCMALVRRLDRRPSGWRACSLACAAAVCCGHRLPRPFH